MVIVLEYEAFSMIPKSLKVNTFSKEKGKDKSRKGNSSRLSSLYNVYEFYIKMIISKQN